MLLTLMRASCEWCAAIALCTHFRCLHIDHGGGAGGCRRSAAFGQRADNGSHMLTLQNKSDCMCHAIWLSC